MRKLDSMWYHEAPGNGPFASSHIAVAFCAFVKCDMVVDDLLAFEFDGIPRNFDDDSLSPMDYCLAYTDGELFDMYIKSKYRKSISELFDGDRIYDLIFKLEGLDHDTRYEAYTLKCTWHNVDVLAQWLNQELS